MSDPHVSITLTFRTPAPAMAVLESLLSAMNQHGMPYELSGTNSSHFDLDEIEE